MQKSKAGMGASVIALLVVGAILVYNALRGETQNDAGNKTPLSGAALAEYRRISPQKAKQMLEEDESIVLLDVRTEEEYHKQHIPDAVWIPDYEISARATSELPDKDALILIYCRSGRRSALAANDLVGMGYTNVYDFGGIISWPYETVS